MKQGIKETKEALIGVLEIAHIVARLLKDGAQVGDAAAFYEVLTKDPVFKATVLAAREGYEQISDEIKDIDFSEGAELFVAGAKLLPKILEELKKK